jgi:hypothetical protein
MGPLQAVYAKLGRTSRAGDAGDINYHQVAGVRLDRLLQMEIEGQC